MQGVCNTGWKSLTHLGVQTLPLSRKCSSRLREAMRDHVNFSHRDVVQGLGAIHLESTSQWPQTILFNHIFRPPVEGQNFEEATTSTTLSTAE